MTTTPSPHPHLPGARARWAVAAVAALLLSFAGPPAAFAADEEATPAATAPDCDTDVHRDAGHQPIDPSAFEECMGSGPEAEGWSQCHHADFNCDGRVGIPDFNRYRTAVGPPEPASTP